MNSKILLITGVAGFIGRYTARLFSRNGWNVIGIDTVTNENVPVSDLRDYYRIQLPDKRLFDIIKQTKPEACIHCAGRASVALSVTDPYTDFHAGPALTFEILNALRVFAPQCRFLLLSSAAIYGNPKSLPVKESHLPQPISPYGFHKWQAELLCQEFYKIYRLPTVIIRIFSAYGPGIRRQVIWDICYKAMIEKNVLLRGTGEESRDFIHVLDIVKALFLIIESAPMEGEVYNVAWGRDVTIKKLSEIILEKLNEKLKITFDYKIPEGNPSNWRADISKIISLGFTPSIELEDGIEQFVDWAKAELTSFI